MEVEFNVPTAVFFVLLGGALALIALGGVGAVSREFVRRMLVPAAILAVLFGVGAWLYDRLGS